MRAWSEGGSEGGRGREGDMKEGRQVGEHGVRKGVKEEGRAGRGRNEGGEVGGESME